MQLTFWGGRYEFDETRCEGDIGEENTWAFDVDAMRKGEAIASSGMVLIFGPEFVFEGVLLFLAMLLDLKAL
jgi:hypothetical protein